MEKRHSAKARWREGKVQTEELRKRQLEDITVMDFSRVLAGLYCTMVLAGYKARIIQIERFGTGDDTRTFGPFVDGESADFMCFNRGKEGIGLDIKSPRDRELLERLIGEADVVAGKFGPTLMNRLGYGAARQTKTHTHSAIVAKRAPVFRHRQESRSLV
jgi:CoA:oxalate CoA-transferase